MNHGIMTMAQKNLNIFSSLRSFFSLSAKFFYFFWTYIHYTTSFIFSGLPVTSNILFSYFIESIVLFSVIILCSFISVKGIVFFAVLFFESSSKSQYYNPVFIKYINFFLLKKNFTFSKIIPFSCLFLSSIFLLVYGFIIGSFFSDFFSS